MGIFKITNVTNQLGKRDSKYNTVVDFFYIDGFDKKEVEIKPGDFVILSIANLPLSIQRLRLKNLVVITELNGDDLNKYLNKEIESINNDLINIDAKEKNEHTVQTQKRKNEKKDSAVQDKTEK